MHSSIVQEYKNRIETSTFEVAKLKSLEKKISRYRLLIFIVTVTGFYLLLSENKGISIIMLISGFGILGYLMNLSLRISGKRAYSEILLAINEKELACINGDFHYFPDGQQYYKKEHPYSADLDIFGPSSVFQYLNRTKSSRGSQLLADWLQEPATKKEIELRQEAVSELSGKLTWRQQLMALGYKYKSSGADPQNIMEWMEEPPQLSNKRYLLPLANIFSLLVFVTIGGTILGLPTGFLTLCIIINFFLAGMMLKQINNIHSKVSRTIEMLKSYSETIAIIENETLESSKLKAVQKLFKHKEYRASEQIKRLSDILHKLDFRLNFVVAIPLNILFFWDIRQVIKLEQWKAKHRELLPIWFESMAEFETLASLGNASFNNPDWIMPEIAPAHFQFIATEMGHPLIPSGRRVTNSLTIEKPGKIVLVTGSNMSGKSTFLRTCGVNIVLAMAGAPVCAKEFHISVNTVFTSMRIIDSLEENTSSFYAELKRLALIIQTIEKEAPVFLLLDEILRGTNSNDRHIGSVALIHQFIKNKATGIIATHDLDLSKLEDELPGQLDNYNFDVKIENDELYFDYRLNKGICKSLNASMLMRKMGIRV